ncbi:uncharacterized protein [Diabrotica undecimpunctata]|uniref:uncharacterized protein n=1 Tax=Diabrotica undecimpunctata TaxID=50387 RepID=UPI003B6427E2
MNRGAGITSHSIKNGYVNVYVGNLVVHNCYVLPNIPLRVYEEYIESIMQEARMEPVPVVIAGDLNAKDRPWNPRAQDGRGKYLSKWIHAMGLTILNDGKAPTFVRVNSESFLDITLVLTTFLKGS